jgi:hypothetical protein
MEFTQTITDSLGFLSDNQTVFFIMVLLVVIGLAIAGLYIARALLHARSKSSKAFHKTILLIRVPKEKNTDRPDSNDDNLSQVREQIAVADTLFSALAGLPQDSGFSAWLKGRNDHVAFEIVVQNSKISFYVSVPDKIRDFVEQQIHAQYPHAEISEEVDYNIFKPESTILGAYLWFKHNSVFPFKTYKKMDSDPLVGILNPLSKIMEDEDAVIQYIVRPAPAR